ncbi:MAG: hypothetical protein JWP01_653 [Myxococcales bacterium]|nr:hypothetical protein [Myxococcales bacterium]
MRILLAATAVLVACGPSGRDPDNNGMVDAPGSQVDAPATGDVSRVYAHSGGTLYRLNPTTLSANPIGAMAGITDDQDLLDLAVDKNDRLVGITRTKLYGVNASTGAALLIKDLTMSAQGFTSLSYVPGAQVSDPDQLVSANNMGEVFSINETTGSATVIGNYGMHNGMQVKSSGDLFGVRGLGIFATVDVGTGTMDYLAKVDPTQNWKATPLPSATGYDKIFGLGFWGGRIYGFVDDGFDAGTGKLIQIDPVTGAATMLSSGAVRWFGAGVATDAPLIQ